eukprot:349785-Chlamydomonas_euryale.AAC.12
MHWAAFRTPGSGMPFPIRKSAPRPASCDAKMPARGGRSAVCAACIRSTCSVSVKYAGSHASMVYWNQLWAKCVSISA